MYRDQFGDGCFFPGLARRTVPLHCFRRGVPGPLELLAATKHFEVNYPSANLAVLENLPAQRLLVASGFRWLPEGKLRAVGLDDWFTSIHVDAIDEPGRNNKHGRFQELLATHGLKLKAVLVVSDFPGSEIDAGVVSG